MSKHTPGPWFLVNSDRSYYEDCEIIVTSDGEEVLGISEWVRADVPDLRLMAAAPDLLEESQKLIDLHVKAMNGTVADHVQWDSAVLNLRSAIEKAKGEQE